MQLHAWNVFALLFAAFLAPQFASTAVVDPHSTLQVPNLRIVRWSHGDPAIQLMPAVRGFCFISGLGGNFEGGGEGVRLWIDDGSWWVGGYSCQPSLWIEVTCMEWSAVDPRAPPSSGPSLPRRTPREGDG